MPQEKMPAPPLKVRLEQLKKIQINCKQAIAICGKASIADGLDAWAWLKNLEANIANDIEVLRREIKAAKEMPDEEPVSDPIADSVPCESETEQPQAE